MSGKTANLKLGSEVLSEIESEHLYFETEDYVTTETPVIAKPFSTPTFMPIYVTGVILHETTQINQKLFLQFLYHFVALLSIFGPNFSVFATDSIPDSVLEFNAKKQSNYTTTPTKIHVLT